MFSSRVSSHRLLFLFPGRCRTYIEVHYCHDRVRFWGGSSPNFLLWLIAGHCWTRTELQAAFVSRHDRCTMPVSGH